MVREVKKGFFFFKSDLVAKIRSNFFLYFINKWMIGCWQKRWQKYKQTVICHACIVYSGPLIMVSVIKRCSVVLQFSSIYNCQRQELLIFNLIRTVAQMAKKQKQIQKPTHKDIRSFPISKSKSFILNLNAFIKMLKTHHSNLSSRQFLTEMHHFINKYKANSKHKETGIGAARDKIRICKSCDGWSGNLKMLQCALCEDFYHENCLGDMKEAFQQSGLCFQCDRQKIKSFDKQTYLNELIQDRCYECGIQREDKEAFVHCLKCANRFHKKCYGKNVVVCSDCKHEIDQQLKKKPQARQSTLEEWGCSSKKKEESREQSAAKKMQSDDQQFSEQNKSKNNDESKTQPFRQKDSFCYNCPEMTEQEIEKYKQGLMFAILAKNMKYTQELQPTDCTLENNTEESLDFGLDHMSRNEYQVYKNYKKQPIGPFRFVFKEGMGYDVIADKDIKEKTLICEYIGEVITLRKCVDLQATNKNDSIMDLRVGCNSDETLIIRPEKLTNMARFINGINNSKGSNKANVATVRKLAKGIPSVMLYSMRAIKKGQSLLYDYNAGNTTCHYDTSNFL